MTTPTSTPTMTALRERAMLAHLEIRRWSPGKTDRKATAELAAEHSADVTALRVRKTLLRANGALQDIGKYASQARARILAYTVPWDAAGWRLLPNEHFVKMTEELRRDKAGFEHAVRQFLASYEEEARLAEHFLGTLYDPNDYPSLEQLGRRFGFRVEFREISDASNLRSELDETMRKAVIESMEEGFKLRLDETRRDLFERVHAACADMAERLARYQQEIVTDPDTGREQVKTVSFFRDSIVEGVRDLVRVLPTLNVSGDPELARMVEQIHTQLGQWDAQTLRDDEEVREFVVEQAEALRDEARQRADELVSSMGG